MIIVFVWQAGSQCLLACAITTEAGKLWNVMNMTLLCMHCWHMIRKGKGRNMWAGLVYLLLWMLVFPLNYVTCTSGCCIKIFTITQSDEIRSFLFSLFRQSDVTMFWMHTYVNSRSLSKLIIVAICMHVMCFSMASPWISNNNNFMLPKLLGYSLIVPVLGIDSRMCPISNYHSVIH